MMKKFGTTSIRPGEYVTKKIGGEEDGQLFCSILTTVQRSDDTGGKFRVENGNIF